PADRGPGGAGPGRRRADDPLPGCDRRRGPGPGARPVHGGDGRSVRGLLGGRTAARGLVHRGTGLALGVLDNLPLGALAITAVSIFLHLPARRTGTRPRLDYL